MKLRRDIPSDSHEETTRIFNSFFSNQAPRARDGIRQEFKRLEKAGITIGALEALIAQAATSAGDTSAV